MSEPVVERFEQQLAYAGDLRLEWHTLPALPAAEELMRLRDANLTVLNLVAAVEEHRTDAGDEESASGLDLLRLDAKLNLLLELMQRMAARDREPPARRPVRLNAHGVALPADAAAPVVGSTVSACIHLDACRAMPLELPARVMELSDPEWRLLAFIEPGPAMEEAMDRLVFRYHRRQVAIERRGAKTE
jgi:hypothetical protein